MDHDEQLTILQAVALAQVTHGGAAKGSAKLIRTTPADARSFPSGQKNILTAKATDLAMQDNDILFVPSSAAKNAMKDIETALPTAAAASIYRVP